MKPVPFQGAPLPHGCALRPSATHANRRLLPRQQHLHLRLRLRLQEGRQRGADAHCPAPAPPLRLRLQEGRQRGAGAGWPRRAGGLHPPGAPAAHKGPVQAPLLLDAGGCEVQAPLPGGDVCGRGRHEECCGVLWCLAQDCCGVLWCLAVMQQPALCALCTPTHPLCDPHACRSMTCTARALGDSAGASPRDGPAWTPSTGACASSAAPPPPRPAPSPRTHARARQSQCIPAAAVAAGTARGPWVCWCRAQDLRPPTPTPPPPPAARARARPLPLQGGAGRGHAGHRRAQQWQV